MTNTSDRSRNRQPVAAPVTETEANRASDVVNLEAPSRPSDVTAGLAALRAIGNVDQGAQARKAQLLSTATTALNEANALYQGGDANADKAEAAAHKAALALIEMREANLLSQDELSATLGGIFGFRRKKKDGIETNEPSKTPVQRGETIRKRVNRFYDATRFIGGQDVPTFFQPLAVDDVAPMVAAVRAGTLSVWQFYKDTGTLKANLNDRLPAAFNVKTVLNMQAKLAEPGAVETFRNSPGLINAYLALVETVGVIGLALKEEAKAA